MGCDALSAVLELIDRSEKQTTGLFCVLLEVVDAESCSCRETEELTLGRIPEETYETQNSGISET